MDKNIIKVIALGVGLVAIIALIVYIALQGLNLGFINAISVADISGQKEDIELSKQDLERAEGQYEVNMKNLENAKKAFNTEKEAYENISDETIKTIKEATKEEEYFIEYLWINLGNYATAHDLALAIIEPGGTVRVEEEKEDEENKNVEQQAYEEVNPADDVNDGQPEVTSDEAGNADDTSDTTNNSSDLTVQVKGSYIDLADFVFEVENDKELRFRLDNIKMTSAGGTDVTASFSVKDFTVLKSLTD